MQTHKTNGIVLRTVKYGETSIITSVYTELFGLQSYIVKGVRQSSKKSQGKANYFQPAAILQMEVYHNELKQLQFIKEFQWQTIYNNIFFNVVRNAVAVYVVELLQHSIKQPEANPELFYLTEETLLAIDNSEESIVANISLYFTLQLGSALGFLIHGNYSSANHILDLKEGLFISNTPSHNDYASDEIASTVSALLSINNIAELKNIQLNKTQRRQILQQLQTYMALHVEGFGQLKSLEVLQQIIS
ncbi:MAG: DNA repair protein RecO [Chitinophaga sp.]|jgi:DNA repair protein RecO (recombination protein O)|nr:DNA repair protein RecO [Chitinophaga sp.]